MELHHLHVLERDAEPQRLRHPVAGAGVGVGRAGVEPARAAGGEDHRLGPDRGQAAVEQVPGDHALAAALVLDELPDEELLVDLQVALHHLLVEDVHEHVAGDVGRVGGAGLAGGAERALRDAAVVGAREDGAPVLELVDVVRRLVAEDLDRVLVAEVVGALDRVEGVLLGVVLGRVPERRVDPALGRAGVAAGRMDLRDERDVGARVMRLDGRAHARAAGPDDEHIVLRFHRRGRYRIAQASRRVTNAAFLTDGHAPTAMPIMGKRRASHRPSSARPAGLRSGRPRARVAPRRCAAGRARSRAASTDRLDLSLATGLATFAGVWLVAKDWRDLVPSQRDTAEWRLGLHGRSAPAPRDAPGGSAPAPGRPRRAPGRRSSTWPLRSRRTSAGGATCCCRSRRCRRSGSRTPSPCRPRCSCSRPRRTSGGAGWARCGSRSCCSSRSPRSTCSKGSTSRRRPEASGSRRFSGSAATPFCVRHDPVTLRSTLRLIPARGARRPAAVRARRLDRRAGDREPRLDRPRDVRGAALAVGAARLPRRARRRRRGRRRLRPARARRLPRARSSGRSPRRARCRTSTCAARCAAWSAATAPTRSPTSSSAATSTTSSAPTAAPSSATGSRRACCSSPATRSGPATRCRRSSAELGAFAEARGLKLAALGVGETLLPALAAARPALALPRRRGRRRHAAFSLEGRAIRKVRQSVSRLEKAGYAARAGRGRRAERAALAELEAISGRWREGADERGFAMSLDAFAATTTRDSLVLLARDGDGRARGFLHFAPS